MPPRTPEEWAAAIAEMPPARQWLVLMLLDIHGLDHVVVEEDGVLVTWDASDGPPVVPWSRG